MVEPNPSKRSFIWFDFVGQSHTEEEKGCQDRDALASGFRDPPCSRRYGGLDFRECALMDVQQLCETATVHFAVDSNLEMIAADAERAGGCRLGGIGKRQLEDFKRDLPALRRRQRQPLGGRENRRPFGLKAALYDTAPPYLLGDACEARLEEEIKVVADLSPRLFDRLGNLADR